MEAVIKMVIVHDDLDKDDKLNVAFEANGKTYIGALLFEKLGFEHITEVLEEHHVEGSALEIMLAAYEMMKRHGRIAEDDKTLKTMLHWQSMNGFSDEIITFPYNFKTDTEVLEYIRK